jgi:hypothetical protein
MSAGLEEPGDVPPAPSRVRLEVAIAEMRGMLNTVVAQHNARLDENGRQLAEHKHQIGRLEIDVAQIKLLQARHDAREDQAEAISAAGLSRGQLIAAWAGLIVLVLSSIASTAVAVLSLHR